MNKEFIKKCWKHPRWHSLMVLFLWILILTLLIGIVSIANQVSPKKVNESIQDKNRKISEENWLALQRDNYAFTYTIVKQDETIKYEGKVQNGITKGYRERQDGIISYTIEEGIAYENLVNQKKAISTLYENINSNFLNVFFLQKIVNDIPGENTDILEENDKITYEYKTSIDQEQIKIIVIMSEIQIQSITIETESEMYYLVFHLIN